MSTTEEIGRYTLDPFITVDQLVDDTTLNEVDLNDAFLKQASLAAFYGVMASRASGQASNMKLTRDAVTAKVSKNYRDSAADAGAKLTENSLSEKVATDPRVIEVIKAYNRAVEIEGEVKAVVEAMKQRKDMVVQLGSSERDNAKGEVRMKLTAGTSDRGADLRKKLAKSK